MPLPLSRNQIDKLGERLCDSDAATDEDLGLVQELLLAHDDALTEVATHLRDIGLRPTTRLKTTDTLLDKLRRQKGMRLSRVQDLAGARLVQAMTLTQQDEVSKRILGIWPSARVSDRRESPSFGYRALHLVPQVGGCQVEIQVRTLYQDTWAQVTESLGDRWGRAIRYGGLPDDPDAVVSSGVTRREVVEHWIGCSPEIADLERREDFRERMADAMSEEELAEFDRELRGDLGDYRDILRQARRLLEGPQ